MNSIKHRFTLDLHSTQSQISIPCSLYDTARELCISFADGGKPYHIETGCLAVIAFAKPSGEKLYEYCAIEGNGTVVYPFSQNENTASEEGTYDCEVTLYDTDGEQIASPRFAIVVSERAVRRSDEPISEEGMGIIDNIVKAEMARESAEDLREEYETARQNGEEARGEAEASRANAEAQRATAEASRVSAEAIRASAETARKNAETARANAEAGRATTEAQRATTEEARAMAEAERVSAEKVRKAEFATWSEEVGKVSAFDKRLTNLEAAVSPDIVTPTVDSETAYAKTVPDGALPFAAITEIGGMSYKCENLIPFPYDFGNGETLGITLKVGDDGGVTYNGTATAQTNPYFTSNLLLPKGTYTLSGAPSGASWSTYILIAQTADYSTILAEDWGSGKTFTLEADTAVRICLIIASGATVSNLTVYPMLNKGDTVKPRQPYFTGLRDSKVQSVESVGACLMSAPTAYKGVDAYAEMVVDGRNCIRMSSGWTFKHAPIAFKENTQYTVSFDTKSDNFGNASTGNCVFAFFYTDGTKTQRNFNKNQTTFERVTFTSEAGKTVETIGVVVVQYQIYNYIDIDTFRFVEGTEIPTDCKPYFKNTFAIPEAVQNIDGYGQGVPNTTHYNKVILNPAEGVKKFRREFAKVKLKNLHWGLYNQDHIAQAQLPTIKSVGISVIPNMVIEKYTPNGSYWVVGAGAKNDKTICEWNGVLYVYDTECASLEDFITAFGDIEMLYELATPTETDLSAYFTDDNLIGVEGNGEVTAVNEHKQAVPSKITYMLKGGDIA